MITIPVCPCFAAFCLAFAALPLLVAMSCSQGEIPAADPGPAPPGGPDPRLTQAPSALVGPLAARLNDELGKHHDAEQGLTYEKLLERHRPAYATALGFDPATAAYHDGFVEKFQLSETARAHLAKDGFVVVPSPAMTGASTAVPKAAGAGPADVYYRVFASDLPVFISADSILHAYHRSFDALLKAAEQQGMATVLGSLLDGSIAQLSAGADQASLDARTYLTVAAALLDPSLSVPLDIRPEVERWIALVDAGSLAEVEFLGAPTTIDFSQFKPRGHYTATELLKRYFRAMMWVGRTDLVLAGTSPPRPREEAAARAIAGTLSSPSQKALFMQMDAFYGALVGRTNALTPLALLDLCEKAGLPSCKGDASSMAAAYAAQPPPDYSSRVFAGDTPPVAMRFFPQRFAYCSWVTTRTTTPRLQPAVPGGRAMAMPEDVAFALGSDRAAEYLADDMKQPGREDLPATLEAVRATMDAIPPQSLEPTVMNDWLEGLRAHARTDIDPALPAVMRTALWHDHKLETTLASWAELRHDTILVAEQSTGGDGCQYPKGYVEPSLGLYEALAQGIDRMRPVFTDKVVPYGNTSAFFDHWAMVLAHLSSMVGEERAGKPMSAEELAFLGETVDLHITPYTHLRAFDGWYPGLFWMLSWSSAGLSDFASAEHPSGLSEPIVADVHTDAENGLALEVATEHPGLLVVAIDNNGDTAVYGGPASSYRSFHQPLGDRLDDAQWNARVDAGALPPRPAFASPYWVE
jgi:hypothetical protein